ncbi:hypothetical protein GW835_04340 [archaeon]|nr:hypothetical protein [archaeon]NCP98559.1 hypothetical protein [archaeon]NCQ52407.1 hypothetical protein [archaeon]
MIFNKETEFVTKNSYEIKAFPLGKEIDISKFIDAEKLYVMSFNKKTIVSGNFVSSASENKQAVVSRKFLDALSKEPHLYQAPLKSC